MKLFRKIIFWAHLVVGLAIGLGVAVLAGTGVTMAFEKQIVAWAEGGAGTAPSPTAQRLSTQELLYRVRKIDPELRPTGLTISADRNATAVVALGRDRDMQLNAYTGVRTGTEAPGLRGFFHTTLELHRWLTLSGAWRDVGRGVTGVAALGFLGLIGSGLWLWFPKKWKWSSIKPVLLFKWCLKGKARDWNWHNVLGFWALVPLLFLTLTGLVMSYSWANNLVYRVAGDEPPVPRGTRAGGPPQQRGGDRPRAGGAARPQRPPNYDGLDELWSFAEDGAGKWTSITMRLGGGRRGGGGGGGEESDAGRGVSFVISNGDPALPYNRTTLTLDRQSGEIISVESFADQKPGRRWRALVLPIHRGEILGATGQAIAAVACLAALVLVYTGFALSYRRLVRPVVRRVRSSLGRDGRATAGMQ